MGQTAQGHFDGVGGVTPGSGSTRALPNAGVPSAGTDEVQTATFGGTGGTSTFKLKLGTISTGTIAWSNNNTTLLANINAALDAAFGASAIVATSSTLASGLGDALLTFSGSTYQKSAVATMTATIVTGALTISIAETTPGVDATYRGWPVGQLVTDTTNKIIYINTGTSTAPTWTKVGTQT